MQRLGHGSRLLGQIPWFGCGPVRMFIKLGIFSAVTPDPPLEDGGERLCMAEGLPQVRKEVSARSYFLLCCPAKFSRSIG